MCENNIYLSQPGLIQTLKYTSTWGPNSKHEPALIHKHVSKIVSLGLRKTAGKSPPPQDLYLRHLLTRSLKCTHGFAGEHANKTTVPAL